MLDSLLNYYLEMDRNIGKTPEKTAPRADFSGIDRAIAAREQRVKRKVATKAELRQEIAELRYVGCQMSNICFNVGHDSWKLGNHDREQMRKMCREWDLIARREAENG